MLITHGRIATFGQNPQVIEDGAIYIADDQISAVGPTAELRARYPEAEQLDASGQLVLPGSICAHTHFYGAFARGMAIPGAPARNFVEILQKLWWRLDRALDEESIRLSALVCLVDAIRNGTTTLIDHHASPNLIDGSLDICADAIVQSGLRVCECYEVTDRNGPGGRAGRHRRERALCEATGRAAQSAAGGIVRPARLIHHRAGDARSVRGRSAVVGHRLSRARRRRHRRRNRQRDEVRPARGRASQRKRRAGREDAIGALRPRQPERDRSAGEDQHQGQPSTAQQHEQRRGHRARPDRCWTAGVCVGLGNDGFSNNMYSEMKAAYLVHKSTAHDPRAMPGDTVMRLAYENNARIASLFWPRPLGEITPGAYADLVFLDYFPYTPLTARQSALADHLWRRWHARHDDHRGRQSADARSGLADARRGAHRRAGP